MTIEINATLRNTQGTGASRRLRKSGRVPAVVYGSGDAVMIELDHNDIYHKLRNEAFHASILSLDVEGKKESVLLRDHQYHPFRQQVMHLDFQRVDPNHKTHIKVPLHFVNGDTAPGVKLGGGKVMHVANELEVACLPKDIPSFIEVDLGNMELGQSIHITEVKLPKGVELVAHGSHAGESVVATMQAPRGGAAAAGEAEGEAAAS